jgi:tRNA modification GTPase
VEVSLHDRRSIAKIPVDLLLWPTVHSYTRQPVAELHTLGSPPLLAALLQALCDAGARLAEPGEFTLRAFLAGRLDLAQAEAVLGVIHAHDTTQLETALAQLAGGLSGPLAAIREELVNLLAELEAGLDFAEEDIEFISASELDRRFAGCEEVVRAALEQMTCREDRPAEFRVALAGPPNAGKSSLFNALVRRYGQAGAAPALVSSTPGTTRDYLVARLELSGSLCELVDTAGDSDAIESLSQIDRASGAAADRQRRGADLVLDCIDAASPRALHSRPQPQRCLRVITKADLVSRSAAEQLAKEIGRIGKPGWRSRLTVPIGSLKAELQPGRFGNPSWLQGVVVTSAQDGVGLETLMLRVKEMAIEASGSSGSTVAATAARCRDSLAAASQSLVQTRELAAGGWGDELVAAEIREALHQVGLVVGTVYTDDILDRIFSRFCIGK